MNLSFIELHFTENCNEILKINSQLHSIESLKNRVLVYLNTMSTLSTDPMLNDAEGYTCINCFRLANTPDKECSECNTPMLH